MSDIFLTNELPKKPQLKSVKWNSEKGYLFDYSECVTMYTHQQNND